MTTVGNNAFVFDPTQISGCRLWLDATDPTSITYSSGTSVSQWRDKSGFRNHVSQATASNQPTISSNYVNGRSAMLFTPNQWVQGSISLDSYTRFLVYSNSVVNVGAAVMDGAGFLQNGGGTTYQDAVGYFNPPPSFQTGSFFRIAEAWFPVTGGTSGRIWIDGTEFTSLPFYAPTGNYPSSYVAFGRRGDGIYFTGAVAEAILFNRQLTTSEMNMMEGYLAFKYGLQSRIPSNHPYRTAIVRTLLPNQAFSIPNPIFIDWSPNQISQLQLWLDANDPNANGILPTNASSISTWKDKSPNGFSGTAVNSPTFNTNKQNRLPAIQFNGTNQYINFGNVINLGTSQIVVFAVTQFTGDGSIVQKSSYRGNAGRWFLIRFAGDGGLEFGADATGSGVNAPFSDSTTTTQLIGGIWDRITLYTFQNGTQKATASLNNSSSLSNTDNLLVGAYGDGSGTGPQPGFYLNGFICEILIYQSSITTAQRQQIEGYLAWKWGLQVNLPSSHPYKTSVPIRSGIAINSLTTMTQGLWTPRRVSGLQLWLDAADPNGTGVTPANGSTISTWKDKSSNGFSGTAINSPTVQINALNKLPVVRFNGTNQYINFGNVLNLGTNPLTIFIITKFDTTNESGIIGKTAYAAANMRWALWYGKSGLGSSVTGVQNIYQDDAQTGSSIVSTNPVTIATQYNLYSYVTSRNTFLLNLNGSLAGSVSNTGTPTNFSTSYNLYVGAYADSTGSSPRATMYLNGDIAEILVYFTNLSVSQYQQVEGYLTWKWGLQSSLPSTHPFVKWPPPP